MATDFTYNNKTINISGPAKPSGKNQPLDPRTEVKLYADIKSIPSPYVGMIVTVLEDETNSNKMTDYKVLSLKANASGIANSVVDQVQRYVDYLGAGSVSQEDINTAVNNYLTENPVQSGATAEQAAQIEANRIAIGDTNSGLIKEVNDIKNIELQNLNTAINTLETLVGLDETVGDKNGLPKGDANIIASINRIDNKTGGQVVYKAPAVNLFNYTTIQQDTVNGVTGYYSDYINYDDSKKYVINMPQLTYKYFDSNKNYVSSQQLNTHNSGSYSIIPTISDNTVKYIRLYFGTSMPNWVNNSHFVEEGTVPLLDYSKTYTTKNRWFGKKLLVLGDGISTERAGLSDITYATQLGIEYGFSSVTNLSISEKTILWHIENLNKYSDDYDLVIIMCGTNDHGNNTTIGDINSTDNTTISGRVDILINALIEKKMEALIVFLTPIKRVGTIGSEDEALNTTDGYYTKSGVTTKEVGEAIKNKCKQYSIPCIDLYDSIEPKLASIRNKYFNSPNDGTHPSTLGHAKYISPKVVSEIGRLAPFPPVSINTSTEVYGNIVTNPSSLSLNSGESGSFAVKLDKAPTNEQTISIESTNSNVTLSARELRFTSDNYNNEQTITFTVPSSVTNNFTISLTNPNVVNKSVEVIVTNGETTNVLVDSVSLNKENITLTVGNTEQLIPTISPSNATNKEVNWSCNNDNCTVVDGLVTAIKEGSSVITVTTVDGNKTANCNVTVSGESSKDIIEDGLVFRLDGKNTDSNAYLTDTVNGVTCNILNTGYTKTNNGVVIPKDSTACIEIPASETNYGITNEMTLEVQTISPGKLSVFGKDANSSIAADNVFKVYINYMNTSDVSSYKKNQNYDVENANKFMTGLHRISVTISTDGNVLTYVDGELYTGFSDTIITDYKDLSTLFASKNYSLKDTMYSGKSVDESTFVSMTLYNRALSADEIKQNYDSDLFLENILVLP